MAREIIWAKQALASLVDAITWISEQSPQQASMVEEAILKQIEASAEHPEKHPMDKFKLDNPGHYRAFETHSYRVSYTYNERQLRILRVRHVKQNPKLY
jgi:plasmid stabilization system protein ParE